VAIGLIFRGKIKTAPGFSVLVSLADGEMETRHRIIIGDVRDMGETGDASAHLIVTSPPRRQGKDSLPGDRAAFLEAYGAYINNLNLVWKECHRVLHEGCRLCISVGDQFTRSDSYGRYKVIPVRTEIIRFCETIGFDYMGAIIWQKVAAPDVLAGARIMGSYPYPRNGILKINYEFILIFKKWGEAPATESAIKEQSQLTREEWQRYFADHWYFPGEKGGKIRASFPEELPRRLIRMFSFVGDTVLDPFLGSGATSLAAKNLGRNSVGYEADDALLPAIKDKLGLKQGSLFLEETFEIIRRKG
jgi:DNA modification methylase